jgi:hypothetical protein
MDELRESSLLFSLEGLMETERERVQREAREAERRREDELRRVAELAERRRLAVQQEREAKQRREALERERERLEQEHLDAMKHATVERARIEAEARVRLVEVEQRRKHELELSRIALGQRTQRYQLLTWLSTTVLGVSLGGAFTAYFGWIAPAHARELSHWQNLATVGAAQTTATERALTDERRKTEALTGRVHELEAQGAAAARSDAKSAPPKPPLGARGPTPPIITSSRPSSHDCADDGDPLSPRLPCARGSRSRLN